MEEISKKDIEDILLCSKKENRKYIYRVLSIKNMSSFDMAYVMSNLSLSDKKLKLIEYSISKYSENETIKSNESINEYIFEIIKNIEKLEKSNERLLEEIMDCKCEIQAFKKILDYIIEKNIELFKPVNYLYNQNFVFSKIYIDK